MARAGVGAYGVKGAGTAGAPYIRVVEAGIRKEGTSPDAWPPL